MISSGRLKDDGSGTIGYEDLGGFLGDFSEMSRVFHHDFTLGDLTMTGGLVQPSKVRIEWSKYVKILDLAWFNLVKNGFRFIRRRNRPKQCSSNGNLKL